MIRTARYLPPSLLCAAVAIVGGIAGGATAVHGLKLNRYGPIEPPALARESVATIDAGAEGSGGCAECSERDLGYRWASLQAISSPAECPHDSWDFRRGCLEYTGGS